MNYFQIKSLQKKHGLSEVQNMIDKGQAFKHQGDISELAWSMIYSGACMLPNVIHGDHTGQKIAARQMVPKGSIGSYQRCQDFWNEFVGRLKSIA
jgi:hypothetical protein